MGRPERTKLDRMFQHEVGADGVETIATLDFELTQQELDPAHGHDLVIYADVVSLGEDVKFPGRNLTINARVILLKKSCTIDTSVTDPKTEAWQSPRRPIKPKRDESGQIVKDKQGEIVHEDGWFDANAGVRAAHPTTVTAEQKHGAAGVDGAAGSPGIDAGNITLLAERFELVSPALKLTLRANGSRGGRGEDGGDGEPGGPGPHQRSDFHGDEIPTLKSIYDGTRRDIQGGNGGRGGHAGRPGTGGRGGDIRVAHILEALPAGAWHAEALGGAAGAPASPGKGAPGGKAGSFSGARIRTYPKREGGMVDYRTSFAFDGEIGPSGPPGAASSNAQPAAAGRVERDLQIRHADLVIGGFSLRTVPINRWNAIYQSGATELDRYRDASWDGKLTLWLGVPSSGPRRIHSHYSKGGKTPPRGKKKTEATPDPLAGPPGQIAVQEISFLAQLDATTAASLEQRLMVFNKVKIAFLNGDLATVEELLTWLHRVTPEPGSFQAFLAKAKEAIERLHDQIIVGPKGKTFVTTGVVVVRDGTQRYKVAVGQELLSLVNDNKRFLDEMEGIVAAGQATLAGWYALHARVAILIQYANAHLDFYGHAADYVPLLSPAAYKKRIDDLLLLAKSVEEQHSTWQRADWEAKVAVENAKTATGELKQRLSLLSKESENEIAWLRLDTTNDKLQALDRGLATTIESLYKKYDSTFAALDSNLSFARDMTTLRLLAQVVLVGTGNFGAAQWLGYAEKAVKAGAKVAKVAGADAGAVERAELVSKEFGNVKSNVKDMKDVLGGGGKSEGQKGTATGPGGVKFDIKMDAPPDSPKPVAEKAIETILPMVEQVTELIELEQKVNQARKDYSSDKVLVAMREGSYAKLIDKLVKDAGVDGDGLKTALDEYTAKVQERNAYYLEHRAKRLKVLELNAQAQSMNAQMARWNAEIAVHKDLRRITMTAFWAQLYDTLRDRILDLTYEAWRAYVYETLDERPFAHFSSMGLGEAKLPDDTMQQQLAAVGANQNEATLRALHNALQDAHTDHLKNIVRADVILEGDKGRVCFEAAAHERQFEDLKKIGEALFCVSPDHEKFYKIAQPHFTEVKAFLPGAEARGNIHIKLEHTRAVKVKDLEGRIHTFSHGPVEALVYDYKIHPTGKEPAPEPKAYRYRDMELKQDYIQMGRSELRSPEQLRVSPCTWWRVCLPKEQNKGLDLSNVKRLVLQFTGDGRDIP